MCYRSLQILIIYMTHSNSLHYHDDKTPYLEFDNQQFFIININYHNVNIQNDIIFII